jgi:hypothetical protein
MQKIENIVINQLSNINVVFRVSKEEQLPKKAFSDPEKLE